MDDSVDLLVTAVEFSVSLVLRVGIKAGNRKTHSSRTFRRGIALSAFIDSVASVIDAARQRGLHYEGPVDGGRIRPDGARLAWHGEGAIGIVLDGASSSGVLSSELTHGADLDVLAHSSGNNRVFQKRAIATH